MKQNWDQHLKSMFDESHQGELVSSMEILSKGKTAQNEDFLKFRCTDCNTEFQADLVKGGQNTVVRKNEQDKTTDELWCKCPACGCEWNGIHNHYYAVSIILASHDGPFGMKGADAKLVGCIQALDTKTASVMAEEVFTSKVLQEAVGTVVQQVPAREGRAVDRICRYQAASTDPNTTQEQLSALADQLSKEEADDRRTQEQRMKMGREYARKQGGGKGPASTPDISTMIASLLGGGAPYNRNNNADNNNYDNNYPRLPMKVPVGADNNNADNNG